MFDDTGTKLQFSAKILFWVEAIAAVLFILISTWNLSVGMALFGLFIVAPFVILVAYVKCLFLIVIADIWDSVVK